MIGGIVAFIFLLMIINLMGNKLEPAFHDNTINVAHTVSPSTH